jgi:hypothetical protein
MRRIEMMTAGGVTLAGLGALVGLAIGSAGGSHLPAPRVPPVEVRTEVVRRTVNVYRHERPHHVAGAGPGRPSSSSATPALALTRTRASGAPVSAPSAPSTPAVTTRSSGVRSAPSSGAAGPKTHNVTTRSSGGRASGAGEHDDRSND